MALREQVIDQSVFDELNRLHDFRNRAVHRYITSKITTSQVLDIGIAYEKMILKLNQILYAIENSQLQMGIGITSSIKPPGYRPGDDKQQVKDMADKKHGHATLAKNLRLK